MSPRINSDGTRGGSGSESDGSRSTADRFDPSEVGSDQAAENVREFITSGRAEVAETRQDIDKAQAQLEAAEGNIERNIARRAIAGQRRELEFETGGTPEQQTAPSGAETREFIRETDVEAVAAQQKLDDARERLEAAETNPERNLARREIEELETVAAGDQPQPTQTQPTDSGGFDIGALRGRRSPTPRRRGQPTGADRAAITAVTPTVEVDTPDAETVLADADAELQDNEIQPATQSTRAPVRQTGDAGLPVLGTVGATAEGAIDRVFDPVATGSATAAGRFEEGVVNPSSDVVGDVAGILGEAADSTNPLSDEFGTAPTISEFEDDIADLRRPEAQETTDSLSEDAVGGLTRGVGNIGSDIIRLPETVQTLGELGVGAAGFTREQIAAEGPVEGGLTSAQAGGGFALALGRRTVGEARENPFEFAGNVGGELVLTGGLSRAQAAAKTARARQAVSDFTGDTRGQLLSGRDAEVTADDLAEFADRSPEVEDAFEQRVAQMNKRIEQRRQRRAELSPDEPVDPEVRTVSRREGRTVSRQEDIKVADPDPQTGPIAGTAETSTRFVESPFENLSPRESQLAATLRRETPDTDLRDVQATRAATPDADLRSVSAAGDATGLTSRTAIVGASQRLEEAQASQVTGASDVDGVPEDLGTFADVATDAQSLFEQARAGVTGLLDAERPAGTTMADTDSMTEPSARDEPRTGGQTMTDTSADQTATGRGQTIGRQSIPDVGFPTAGGSSLGGATPGGGGGGSGGGGGGGEGGDPDRRRTPDIDLDFASFDLDAEPTGLTAEETVFSSGIEDITAEDFRLNDS